MVLFTIIFPSAAVPVPTGPVTEIVLAPAFKLRLLAKAVTPLIVLFKAMPPLVVAMPAAWLPVPPRSRRGGEGLKEGRVNDAAAVLSCELFRYTLCPLAGVRVSADEDVYLPLISI